MLIRPRGSAHLQFNPNLNGLIKEKRISEGLSAVVRVNDYLWVANDESVTLERLALQKQNVNGVLHYGDHRQFQLCDYLDLPVPPTRGKLEEVDIEGMDYANGYLWIIGSHSLTRKNPKKDCSMKENIDRLASVEGCSNRFLLARIPLTSSGEPGRVAAQLRRHNVGDDLTHALQEDQHLGGFLAIPSKENGFDIEGLAVTGKRVFVGLRGPVLRGYAVILELEVEQDNNSVLKLIRIGSEREHYLKHFLDLGGLGIRDLCVRGPDLFILAGPTMYLDDPAEIFCWSGGARPKEGNSLVCALPPAQRLPLGKEPGKDHAEGMTLFSSDGLANSSLLVVYDSTSDHRRIGPNSLLADIFPVP